MLLYTILRNFWPSDTKGAVLYPGKDENDTTNLGRVPLIHFDDEFVNRPFAFEDRVREVRRIEDEIPPPYSTKIEGVPFNRCTPAIIGVKLEASREEAHKPWRKMIGKTREMELLRFEEGKKDGT
eukprot:Trichotokara_eunicae@DN376_c0_g1_i2.p2